ncbi:hypothetical protein, partial [Pseudomonas helleri]|uniref:hypothetical protein n=1 Tax=Pseudomonas helleri TaxID=1608996 RepID=UPI001E44C4DC
QALGLEDAVRSAYRGERCTYVLNSGSYSRELFGRGNHVKAANFGAGVSELARQKSRGCCWLSNFCSA